jgi:hypothetical protein
MTEAGMPENMPVLFNDVFTVQLLSGERASVAVRDEQPLNI